MITGITGTGPERLAQYGISSGKSSRIGFGTAHDDVFVRQRVRFGQNKSFGREEVSDIDAPNGTVKMNGTRVTGKVNAGSEITAQDADLNDVYSTGQIFLYRSTVRGTARSGGPLKAVSCPSINILRTESKVEVEHCPSVEMIKAGDFVELENSQVMGDVVAGNGAYIKDESKIHGTLTVKTRKLEIHNSKLNRVVVALPDGDKDGDKKPLQEIILNNGSEITGKIEFEGGNGIVRVRSGSRLPRKENIIGGKLEVQER